jgi:hypothetical protein
LCFYDFDPYGLEAYKLIEEQFKHFNIPVQPELILFDEKQMTNYNSANSTIDYDTKGKLGKLTLRVIPQPSEAKTTGNPLSHTTVKQWLKKRKWRCELDSLTPTQLMTIAEEHVLKYVDYKALQLERMKSALETTYITPTEPYAGFTQDLEIAKNTQDLQSIEKKARAHIGVP